MSAAVLTDVELIMGSFDMSAFTGAFEIYGQAQMKEAPHLAGKGYQIFLPGLNSAYASIKGHCDFASGGINQTFKSANAGQQNAFALMPTGSAAAVGDQAFFMRGLLSKMKMITGATGEVADFEMQLSSDTAGVDGFVGAPLATRGALTGTQVQTGAVTASQRLWAALFITGGVFTNLAVTIQSDTVGFPSPATQITFSTVSAAGWQFSSVAGPITDDYMRVSAAIGSGTATYAVVFGVY